MVGAVVAVRGRSLESPDAAALEVEGFFLSPDSSFLIRDLSSSSSSHTVSAVCDSTDESVRCWSELSVGDSWASKAVASEICREWCRGSEKAVSKDWRGSE